MGALRRTFFFFTSACLIESPPLQPCLGWLPRFRFLIDLPLSAILMLLPPWVVMVTVARPECLPASPTESLLSCAPEFTGSGCFAGSGCCLLCFMAAPNMRPAPPGKATRLSPCADLCCDRPPR